MALVRNGLFRSSGLPACAVLGGSRSRQTDLKGDARKLRIAHDGVMSITYVLHMISCGHGQSD